ncbi:amidase signature domain-containing protein [Dichotomopilus funicola]|uniref:amidase n=1 Tax=Dichotomopilus funicola TaxID=1934379 RepID=A0AAN6ZJF6_9PEZI|nr:amidase signature domain-containing protein [Dichotomopilus funicola]
MAASSSSSFTLPQWQATGQAKREEILRLLPPEWRIDSVPTPQALRNVTHYSAQFLTTEERDITETLSAAALLGKLSRGELTALQVTKAFCHRATIAHQLTNCLSEVNFTPALSDAEALDAAYDREGKVVGPLHGLPVSLKDQFRVRDTETSVGYVGWLGKKETTESESWIVQQLRKLGAIVFVKTNVPTSLMAIETNNNIVGYTLNAANRLLSSGGSSGGEGALIAAGGSIIGLGSDVGASIRLPSGFNGIVGLRPSHGRLPYLGVANSMLGHQTLESVIGPMGRNIADLRLFVRAILGVEPWKADPKVLTLPWRDSEELKARQKIASKKLTFGVLRDDGVVTPHPPVGRVVEEAAQKLTAHGYEVIEWEPPAHSEAFEIAWAAFTADAGRDIHNQLSLSGEVPVPELAAVYGETFGHLPPKTVNNLWDSQRRRDEFQISYLRYWESTCARTSNGEAVDAIIVPVAPTVGYERGKGLYPGYTAAYTVLDYSVAVVRAGKADAAKDLPYQEFKAQSDFDAMIHAQCMYFPAHSSLCRPFSFRTLMLIQYSGR